MTNDIPLYIPSSTIVVNKENYSTFCNFGKFQKCLVAVIMKGRVKFFIKLNSLVSMHL